MVVSLQFRSSHTKYMLGFCLANLLQSCGKQTAYNMASAVAVSEHTGCKEPGSIDAKNNEGETSLHIAAKKGNLGTIKTLITRCADKDAKNNNGDTPFMLAAKHSHMKAANTLLEAGAKITDLTGIDLTPLVIDAVVGNHPKALNALLSAGVSAEVTYNNQPLLYTAVKFGHVEVVKILVDEGIKVDIIGTLGGSLLLEADEVNVEIVQILINKNASVKATDRWDNTPLILAAKKGHAQVMQILIDAGSDKNAKDKEGHTPLSLAVANMNMELIYLLIAAGVKIEASTGINAEKLAVMAITDNRFKVLEALLAQGVSTEAMDDQTSTLLHIAASKGYKDIVNMLLNKRAKIYAKSGDGTTPLHAAAKQGNPEVVNELIAAGADKDAIDNQGNTPIFGAAAEGHLEVVNALIAAGAKADVKNIEGKTPLYNAISEEHVEVTEMLLKKCTHFSAQVMEVLFKQCAADNGSERSKHKAIQKLFIDHKSRENCTTSGGSRMSGFLPDMIKAVGSGMATTSQYIYHLAFGTAKNYNQGSSIGYNGFDAPLNKALSPYDATNQNLFFMHYVLSFFNKDYRNRTQLTYLSYNELSEEELFLHQLQAAEAMAKLEGWAETIE